jgi:uncharacterized membrane protein YedE/YeeE
MNAWPFWAGAIALAGTALGHLALLQRPLGVSGSLSSALSRAERKAEADSTEMTQADLHAALERATREAFGSHDGLVPADDQPAAGPPADASPRLGRPLAWSTQVLFLVGIAVGAALSGALAGRRPTFDVGPTFRALIGDGARAFAALFVGGLLVGFGTRMAAGCTSGHGLVGCGRLRPASLIATACFFGTAIVVSVGLERFSR